jgi:hypothetical protein
LIVASIVVGAFLGFAISFYSIVVAVVGFAIAVSDAITMRTEFMLTFYREEIINYLQGKKRRKERARVFFLFILSFFFKYFLFIFCIIIACR